MAHRQKSQITVEGAAPSVELPAPTAAPIVLALGVALLLGGLITNLAFCVLGALVSIFGATQWFRQLLGSHESVDVPLEAETRAVVAAEARVATLRPGVPGYRLTLPEQYHPYWTGAWAGLIGGVAMAITAIGYGLVSGHGPWYPINLLAGMVLWNYGTLATAELEQFRWGGLLAGIVIHGISSVGLGLIYGVLLPTLPGRPIVSGGFVAPLLWTAAIYSSMNVLNPTLREIIIQPAVMPWFVVSQFVYGVTVGIVVVRTEKIPATPMRRASRGGPTEPTRRGGNP